MKSRIPEFFNFMKVERQIEWEKRLFCFHAWGGNRDPNSGMYRYICHMYGILFGSFHAGTFDQLCKHDFLKYYPKVDLGSLKKAFSMTKEIFSKTIKIS